MFYFSFISHVRASEIKLKQICFISVLFQFYFTWKSRFRKQCASLNRVTFASMTILLHLISVSNMRPSMLCCLQWLTSPVRAVCQLQYNTIQYKTYNAPYVTKMLFVGALFSCVVFLLNTRRSTMAPCKADMVTFISHYTTITMSS